MCRDRGNGFPKRAMLRGKQGKHKILGTNAPWSEWGSTLGSKSQGPLNGGGFPIWTCPSFFVLFCSFGTFPIFWVFLICPGMARGFSRLVLFLFLGLLAAPMRNSPERVRDTIRTFPEESGKPPGLETPRLSFSQKRLNITAEAWPNLREVPLVS